MELKPPAGAEARPLLIGDGWHEVSPGGLNRYFADLLDALPAVGVDPTGLVLGPVTDGPAEVLAGGLLSEPLPMRLASLHRAAGRAAADVTVVDAHFALNALLPVLLGPLRRLPLVVHFQGPWADEGRVGTSGQTLEIWVKRLIELVVYQRARRIVVLSAAFKQVLVERYSVDPWRIEVVPPGVDLSRFCPGDGVAARHRLELVPHAPVVVTVRRLVPRMGLDVLLRAWPEVRDTNPAAVLLVVGDGPSRSELEGLAGQLDIATSVRFLGRVDDDQLVECYRAADLSVVPTVALEGFGLIVLEALACGTPVVASDVAALPEALARLDPNLLVPAGEPGPLAARISGALDGSLPAPSAERCREYATSFGWEHVAQRHRAIYERASHPLRDTLRVVYLDHCAELSGAELTMLRLLPALGGVDAHVILGDDGPLVKKLRQACVSVEVLPMAAGVRNVRRGSMRPGHLPIASGASAGRYVVRLARRLRQLRPDIVHTNSLKAAVYGGLAARLAGLPVVWHLHDRIAPDCLPPSAVHLVRAASRRLPAAILANSRATLETLGPISVPTAVGPSPVDHALWEQGPAPPRAPNDALRVGIVGRLTPWKGQLLFLDAFARAFPEGPEEAVVIGSALFGEDDYERELRAKARKHPLDGRVSFTGFVEDVAAVLAGLDVVVHASLVPEPFGLVVVEAMAMGRAVVAADAGGPSEVISDGTDGLLYPLGDGSAMAGCLRRLSDDRGLRDRLGAAARKRAGNFRPENTAATVMALYHDVLGDKWPADVPLG